MGLLKWLIETASAPASDGSVGTCPICHTTYYSLEAAEADTCAQDRRK